jgi:hypothetical protein
MSVQQAVAWLDHLRRSPDEAARVRGLTDMDAAVSDAAASGFHFSADDVRAAFRHDYALRRLAFRFMTDEADEVAASNRADIARASEK